MSPLVRQIRDLCSSDVSESALYERAADCIYDSEERFNWVGLYKVEKHELLLVAWRGPQPTVHVRIPLDQGICGFAATSGETVVSNDVNSDPRYLACFANTKSEMVVPINGSETVLAEIDIDSDTLEAFAEEDREILEEIAGLLGAKITELRS